MKAHNKINNLEQISCVIAAAGKGTRAKLNYPKCLYMVKGKVILGRLFDILPKECSATIIVSNDGEEKIKSYLQANQIKAGILIQEKQNGMGGAILSIESISHSLKDHILLAWGDLPYIAKDTIDRLIAHHFLQENDFSLVTSHTDQAYTVVERNKNSKVVRVIESREHPNLKVQRGERDIGIFLFKKDIVFEFLKRDLPNKFGKQTKEHGFLYIIEHLVEDGFKVGTVESSNPKETISFNSISDLT